MIIKIEEVDCFFGQDYHISDFINIEECIKKCQEILVNVFIYCKSTKKVYYRINTIKECVKNIVYKSNAIMYIWTNDISLPNYYSENERLTLYTKGIQEKKIFSECNEYYSSKRKINNYLKDEENEKQWIYQHHFNLNEFLNNNRISDDFSFYFNPYDLDWSVNIPTFVKSRNLKLAKKSVLLPLEKLYIPSFYKNILCHDIQFNEKMDSCVWRGANSGNFFKKSVKKGSRYFLVSKYYNNPKYNIGLSYANYKRDIKKNNNSIDANKFVKQKLSIKEQLKYKFIISVEGNDFATNLSWIMLSNSVPLMPRPYVETWKMESKLIEYKHYVPLENDFSDLDEKMDWCLKNQEKCEEIAYQSKFYILQFFDSQKENNIIRKVINKYKQNVQFSD